MASPVHDPAHGFSTAPRTCGTVCPRLARSSIASYRKPRRRQVPGVQFYKAATSAWSNYRASKRGRSRPEFISKLGIAVEEIDEAARLA